MGGGGEVFLGGHNIYPKASQNPEFCFDMHSLEDQLKKLEGQYSDSDEYFDEEEVVEGGDEEAGIYIFLFPYIFF